MSILKFNQAIELRIVQVISQFLIIYDIFNSPYFSAS